MFKMTSFQELAVYLQRVKGVHRGDHHLLMAKVSQEQACCRGSAPKVRQFVRYLNRKRLVRNRLKKKKPKSTGQHVPSRRTDKPEVQKQKSNIPVRAPSPFEGFPACPGLCKAEPFPLQDPGWPLQTHMSFPDTTAGFADKPLDLPASGAGGLSLMSLDDLEEEMNRF